MKTKNIKRKDKSNY